MAQWELCSVSLVDLIVELHAISKSAHVFDCLARKTHFDTTLVPSALLPPSRFR